MEILICLLLQYKQQADILMGTGSADTSMSLHWHCKDKKSIESSSRLD